MRSFILLALLGAVCAVLNDDVVAVAKKEDDLTNFTGLTATTTAIPASTARLTTTTTVRSTTTARPWNQATTKAPAPSSACGCSDPKTIWLDIIFLIDTSSAMTSNGLDELNNYLLTTLGRMSVSQAQGSVSRVGFITYSANSTVYAPLNQYQNYNDILNNYNPVYDGQTGSNIESGIRAAISQFGSNGHRSNVKKVLVIAASHYEPGSSVDPVQAAETFKEDGGIIITLEYVQTHGASVPILSSLATKCMQLSNKDFTLHSDDLIKTFCNANCFCASGWTPYDVTGNCNQPDGGCYFPVQISSNEPLAARYCTKQRGGSLPKIEDNNKNIFIASQINNGATEQWLGLTYNGAVWTWADGTVLGGYQPWQSQGGSNQCAYMKKTSGFNVKWFSADCMGDYLYTCQANPCSADKYCAVNQ